MIVFNTGKGLVILGLVFVLFTLVAVSGCGDYSISLPGDYSLAQIYGGAVVICGPPPNRIIRIHANIDGYKVINGLVVGHVVVAERSEKEYSKPGYFIINTKTDVVLQSLDKKTWLDSLRILGVNEDPALSMPTMFDKNYQ